MVQVQTLISRAVTELSIFDDEIVESVVPILYVDIERFPLLSLDDSDGITSSVSVWDPLEISKTVGLLLRFL